MTRLFSASSEWDNVDGFDCVKIWWFYRKKNHHIGYYDKIVKNYGSMDPAYRQYSEEIVDEYLTSEEIEQVKAYVERNGYSLKVKEIPLPTDTTGDVKVTDLHDGKFDRILALAKPEEHGVSFDLGLCYCTAGCPLTVQVPTGYVDSGQEFVERIIQKLNIPSVDEIRKAVEDIYQDYGLCVSRGKYTSDGELFVSFLAQKLKVIGPFFSSSEFKGAVGSVYRETELHVVRRQKRKPEWIKEKQRYLALQEQLRESATDDSLF